MYKNHFPHLIGILIPLPPVIVALTEEKYGFTIVTFPPIFCSYANQDFIKYFNILIFNTIAVIGIPLLIIVAWKLHKVSKLPKSIEIKSVDIPYV